MQFKLSLSLAILLCNFYPCSVILICACVGNGVLWGAPKVCTIVPPNHFGSIPGVEVGSMWKFRVQVSEAGVHRPHVAGIHGREDEGSYSIVLAGGYEDDQV